MVVRLHVVVDHASRDALSASITDAVSKLVSTTDDAVWCLYGTVTAAAELGNLIQGLGDTAGIVYRFPIAYANRIDFITALLASAHQLNLTQNPPSQMNDPADGRAEQTAKRSVAWINEVNLAFSESRLYDALNILRRFGAAELDAELGDLANLCRDSAALCARILQSELELVHTASTVSNRDPNALLTEQFMSEGFFRLLPQKVAAVTVDLEKHTNFAKRRELLSVLGATAAAFRREVVHNNYGRDTSRLFAIHIGFLCQATLHEVAMKRFNEAFGLVFKAFECVIIWEALVERVGFLYGDRLYDQKTFKGFAGTGAALKHVEPSLRKRDPNIVQNLTDLIERRNITRIGHGLRVLDDAEISSYMTRLSAFLKTTAKSRNVTDYLDLMEKSFVFSGFAKQVEILNSAEVLKPYRVALNTGGSSQTAISSPSSAQQKAGGRAILSLRPRS